MSGSVNAVTLPGLHPACPDIRAKIDRFLTVYLTVYLTAIPIKKTCLLTA